MKLFLKTAVLLMCLLLLVCSAFAAQATGEAGQTFASASELYQYWYNNVVSSEDNPYPSYVCGVYTADNGATLTFVLTDDKAGEDGRAEILSLIDDDSSAVFTTGKYSYEQLLAIQIELEQYLGGEEGVNSLGINEMTNVLTVGFVDPEADGAKALIAEYSGKYGDMLVFEQVGMISEISSTLSAEEDASAPEQAPGSQVSSVTALDKTLLAVVILAAVVVVVVGLPMLRKRSAKTDAGEQ